MSIPISRGENLPSELKVLLEKWQASAEEMLSTDDFGWYAKLVKTVFTYNGTEYSIKAEDIFSAEAQRTKDWGYLEAGLEILRGEICDDLKKIGAEKILNYGFLD